MCELHLSDNTVQAVDVIIDCHVCVAESLRAVHRPSRSTVRYLNFIVQDRVIPDHGEVSHNEIGVGHWPSCGGRGSHRNSRYSEYSVGGGERRID